MSTIASLLSGLLTLAFIVGMVKPPLVIGWLKNPNRWKVFGIWVLGTIVLGAMITTEEEQETERLNSMTSAELIESANSNLDSGAYSQALTLLSKIDVDDENYSESKVLETKIREEKNIEFEAEIKAAKEESRVQTLDQLKREIESIDKGIDFSKYRESVEQLQMELILFRVWGSLAFNNIDSEDKEIKDLAAKLKYKVQRIQTKEFPILRKAYGKFVADKMWAEDIYVKTTGKGSNRINFAGGVFAANKNKQQFQETVSDVLNQFRFNQSRYRWYKEADEYTYYTMYEGKDSELITD